MKLDTCLEKTAVLGAGGKMGRGIALLLLQEMARLESSLHHTIGSGKYRLTLIDANEDALSTIRPYLRPLIQKYAEKNINQLRQDFASHPTWISNKEIIDGFVEGAMDIVYLASQSEAAASSRLVFEAIVENVEVKAKVFSAIQKNHPEKCLFFTNTSSIPIHVLKKESGLGDQIIGFHFYNPPPIQKLVELIPSGSSALTPLAEELAKRLGKIVVRSNDVAGFIGNGHFLREILYACEQIDTLHLPFHQAIDTLNRVTQEFLIRPMGIFQLLDYVGIDVAKRIAHIMTDYLKVPLQSTWIEHMVKEGKIGGQHPDGSQKEGFFRYEKGKPAAVYSLEEHRYIPLQDSGQEIGALPAGHSTWKALSKDPQRGEKLKAYFTSLASETTLGAKLAKAFLLRSKEIAEQLVHDGVARSLHDVDTVLINGFYHLYGTEEIVLCQK